MSPTEAPSSSVPEPQNTHQDQNNSSEPNNEDVGVTTTTPTPYHVAPLTPEKASLVESGRKYTVVAWDLDSTGRRLVDEICHVRIRFCSCRGGRIKIEHHVQIKWFISESKNKTGF